MNATIPPTRTRSALRWALPLLLAIGLVGLTPARADAAPLAGASRVDSLAGTTCVVTANQQARCWGEGSQGQIGNDNHVDVSAANTVLDVDGEGPLTGVSRISAGGSHACAVLTNGRAVCWGDDSHGQLGNGPGSNDSETPDVVRNGTDTGPLSGVTDISVGGGYTCALLTSGQARCWGAGSNGTLGDAGPFSFGEHLPRPVASVSGDGVLTGITQLSTGSSHACARLANGQARCWGFNGAGRLGNGEAAGSSNRPTVVVNGGGVAPLSGIAQVFAGGEHSCARLTNGQARCWGEGSKGQLGNNDDLDRPRPVVVRAPAGTANLSGITQLAVGGDHTCFRLTSGQLRCTGDAGQGQLGNPNAGNTALRPIVVRNAGNTGALTGVAEVTAGVDFTCARMTNGQVRCFGSDLGSQQLGNGQDKGSTDLPGLVQAP